MPEGFDTIADAVRAELDRRGMTIAELAERVGGAVDLGSGSRNRGGRPEASIRVALTRWLNGQRGIRSDLVEAVLVELRLGLRIQRGEVRGQPSRGGR